jgi:hypothetical protein
MTTENPVTAISDNLPVTKNVTDNQNVSLVSNNLSVTNSVTDNQKVPSGTKERDMPPVCHDCGRVIEDSEPLAWYTLSVPGRKYRQAATRCMDCCGSEEYLYFHDHEELKECAYCGRHFFGLCTANGKNRRYCTTRCYLADIRDARSHLPKVDKSHVCECQLCHHEFKSKRSDGVYCSNACRQKMYRKNWLFKHGVLPKNRDN